jgi:DNA mismatch repair protein MLH1
MRELAYFYSPAPLFVGLAPASDEDEQENMKSEAWRIQNISFQAMRKYLAAPKFLLDNDVVQVASLPDLYWVFERC